MNILVIDDDSSLRRTLRMSLEVLGHHATEARDSAQALELLSRRPFDTALLDLRLAQEQGLDLLPRLLSMAPGLHVVVVTAYATIETAVEAMRRGAFDYLPKPFTPDQLRIVLDRIAHVRRLQSHVEELEEQVRGVVPEVDLQTAEPKMREALDVAFTTAATEATILLRGESGTGKGVLARAIHARSPRAGGPFVTVHCPSLSAELLESELFGHVLGAFTGAVRDTVGKVAAAEGGTLFLDEIGDLPLALQPKLLRLLAGAMLRAGGRDADQGQQRSHPRRHESRPGRGDGGRPVPRGPLLPPQRDRGDAAAAAAADGRHPAAGRAPAAVLRPAERQACRRIHRAGAGGDSPLPLAGQRPRAAQRRRAGRDPDNARP